MTIPFARRASLPFLLCLILAGSLVAQSAPPRPASRIPANADLNVTTRLTGHTPRWATATADAGAVDAQTPVRVTLLLSRSAEQEAAFTQMLQDQQNPSSPRYHRWLTPAEIGEQFGPSIDDVRAVTGWLGNRNLTVLSVSPSRVFVEASGTAATVGAALGTSFHHYMLDGQTRMAAADEPAIPAALAVAITGIEGLAEIPVRPFHGLTAAEPRAQNDGVHPMGSGSNNTVHYVYPGDFAKIYDVPTMSGGVYAGSGVRVAIIGRSEIASSDITLLESIAGQPASVPNVIIPPSGSDPGYVTTNGDQDESTLDVGRVLTVSPGAQADLVISASSGTSSGLSIAMQYNVQTLLDPVMTISYGACETAAGAANVNYFDALFKQGAAEGISTFVSSGDSLAAGCTTSGAAPTGMEKLGINYFCASSYVTCVGGTEFNDTSNYALYWSATNSTTYTSALGYIPEGAWNEPSYQKTSSGVTSTAYQVLGTGGGPSLYIGKPTWQSGTGVTTDGARDTPDISFTSAGHDPYFACLAYKGSAYDCSKGGGTLFYGTSAAAPDMAAVAAILVQRAGKGQGNLNPVLYSLAATTPTAFHDATPTSSGINPCYTATASICNNSLPGPTSLSGVSGYPLQAGYDEVTGLGSLDVANFVNAVTGSSTVATTTTTVSAAPTAIVVGNTAVFKATVTVTGSTAATGTVQFYSNGTALGAAVALANGTASTPATTFNTAGTYAITATYSGDSSNASSTSSALSFVVSAQTAVGLAVAASPSTLTVAAGATTGNTSNIAVTTTGSYTGTIALTCTVSYSGGTATYPPTCSLAPSTLTFTAGLSGSSVLTVATTTPHAVTAPGRAQNRSPLAAVGGVSFAALLLVLAPSKRRRGYGLMALLPLVFLAMAGCGSSGGTVVTTPPVGTSKGTYTVTVTATPQAGAVATGTVTLTVQ